MFTAASLETPLQCLAISSGIFLIFEEKEILIVSTIFFTKSFSKRLDELIKDFF